MRWNRLITSVCIFLASLSRILVLVIAFVMLIGILSNRFEVPLGFQLDDNYLFESQEVFTSRVSYKGVDYGNVMVIPNGHHINLDELPISKYWTIIPLMLFVTGIYFFLDIMVKLLKSIEEKDFFSLINVKRLRIVGFMVAGFSICQWLYSLFMDYFLGSIFEVDGLSRVGSNFNLSLDFFNSLLFLGLMILLVANAFEHGLKLKEEQELTI